MIFVPSLKLIESYAWRWPRDKCKERPCGKNSVRSSQRVTVWHTPTVDRDLCCCSRWPSLWPKSRFLYPESLWPESCDQNHDGCDQNLVTRILWIRFKNPYDQNYDSYVQNPYDLNLWPWSCDQNYNWSDQNPSDLNLVTLILWPESYGYDSCNQCPYDQNRNSCVQEPCEWPEPHCCSSSLSSRSWQTRSARWSCREEFHTCSWTWLSLWSSPISLLHITGKQSKLTIHMF